MATGSRQWAAAGLMGIMMCAVAVLQMWGSDTRSAMSNTGVKEGVLPSAVAEDSLAWRKAQRGQGMMLADAEDFARQVNGLGAQKLAGSGQLCEKKDFILEKFDQLLTKLQGDDHMLNFTDAATEKAYDDAMQAWLDTESVYRLAVETHKESKEAAAYALKKLAVELKVHGLTKERVERVVKNYPIKKAKIDKERDMILELIKLVEELAGSTSSAGENSSPPATLSAISAKLRQLGAVAQGKKGSSRLQAGLKAVEDKIESSYNKLASSKLAGPSPEEMEATKNEVKKVLLDLLQDPDFRGFMLKMGMMNMMAALTNERQVLQDDEKLVADLTGKEDEAARKEQSTELERGKAAGEKQTSGEEYKDEHEAYLKTSSVVLREIWIIKQIKKKIISFCATGTWAKSSTGLPARLAQAAAADLML